MCGIVGKLNFNGKPVSEREIKKMCQTISHRGPDDEGVWVKGNVGLGNRRLAIIDLTPAGHQPMSNEDKTIWLTFNGEIYNFLSLRKKLIKKGHKFYSKTDSEVIIHLWEEHGVGCLSFLRGMFAFGLWDDKQKILFLARDRLGQKPLKYYYAEKTFIFASELKAILTDRAVKKEPDLQAIDYFLTLEAIPAPLTGFQKIKKLPAGHYLLIKVKSPQHHSVRGRRQSKVKSYWELDFSKKLELDEEEWKGEIIKRLEESVKLRLVADVPIGAFLSGGVDSSAIVAMMAKLGQKNINTFSVGCEDKAYNELDFARLVAKTFQTNHHEIILKPDNFSLLPKLAYYYEEPYGDPSALPTYLVSQLASKKLKVVLNGDGGDENFAGYQRYQKFKILNFWNLLSLYDYASLFIFWNWPENLKQKLYKYDFWQETKLSRTKELLFRPKREKLSWLDNVLKTDINFYLSEVLLPKVDIATMACGLECRSPLLDYKFMEFIAKIPSQFKLRFLTTKYIFKKSLEEILPKEIIHRPKKGFGFPIAKWLSTYWQKKVRGLLLSPNALLKQYFRQKQIEKMMSQVNHGENYARRIWRLVMFEFWLECFFGK